MFKFLLMAPFHVFFIFLTWILAFPLGLLSVICRVKILPGPLKWFHTHDNTLDGGQDALNWPKKTGIHLAVQRGLWMIRNPAYGFRAYVLGFPSEGSKTEIHSQVGVVNTKGFLQKYTITAANGRKYFGIRSSWYWFGWRHPESGGRHLYKLSIRMPR